MCDAMPRIEAGSVGESDGFSARAASPVGGWLPVGSALVTGASGVGALCDGVGAGIAVGEVIATGDAGCSAWLWHAEAAARRSSEAASAVASVVSLSTLF